MGNSYIEYKSDIPDKPNRLKAEIVSFLNAQGGEIWLGVDKQGKPIPELQRNFKVWQELLENWLVNAFEPPVIDLVNLDVNENHFIIRISEGENKPYFFKEGTGFNAKGVFIRVGSSKRQANFDEIKRMILSAKSHKFEEAVSEEQDLKFESLQKFLAAEDINFDPYGLGLKNRSGEYNNAALLLSEQNRTMSKIAVFQGTDVSIFLNKKEFRGSVLTQLDELLYQAGLMNKVKVIITGAAKRQEYLDYPEGALRETICNAFCHRDWSLTGDIKVEFYDDRVQIFSPGSLPDGLTLEDIKQGMTAKRNHILVNVLDKANFIENYASGIRRIFKDYEGFTKQPNFYISANGVVVTLYNLNYEPPANSPHDTHKTIQEGQMRYHNQRVRPTPDQRRQTILNLLRNNPTLSARDLGELLLVSSRTIERDLEKLKQIGYLKREGSQNQGVWIVL
ncbi:MAG: ATP-binding protein [Eubacteriales bacterium]|nr:ATP-binding protein [Eubacteriales bacterium]